MLAGAASGQNDPSNPISQDVAVSHRERASVVPTQRVHPCTHRITGPEGQIASMTFLLGVFKYEPAVYFHIQSRSGIRFPATEEAPGFSQQELPYSGSVNR